ncbi:MAG: glycosyltransferase [Planctomycetaceae bacterium]|nr:glycosyltransferase [Planctomycetaceae bacterium]
MESLGALHLTATLELEQLPSHLAPRARRIVVPNGVERPPDGLDAALLPAVARELHGEGAGYTLFLGRLHRKKGLDLLLHALAGAPEAPPLLVAGPDDGEERALRRLAHELGLATRVHWLGPVAGTAKWALLQHASLHVLPSRSENFGNTVLESLAVGCPVLVTPEVGARDAVLELEGGRVLAANQFGVALCELAGAWLDPKPRRRLAERTALRFGWDAIAARLERELGAPAVGAA